MRILKKLLSSISVATIVLMSLANVAWADGTPTFQVGYVPSDNFVEDHHYYFYAAPGETVSDTFHVTNKSDDGDIVMISQLKGYNSPTMPAMDSSWGGVFSPYEYTLSPEEIQYVDFDLIVPEDAEIGVTYHGMILARLTNFVIEGQGGVVFNIAIGTHVYIEVVDPETCEGPDCPCEGPDCPCEGPDCPCEGPDCPCEGPDCPCEGPDCPCEGPDCPCEGSDCPCEGPDCPCEGPDCPCEGPDCPCEGPDCPCEGPDCPCEGPDCPCEGPDCPCEGPDCPCDGPDCPCEGPDCPCEGEDCPTETVPFWSSSYAEQRFRESGVTPESMDDIIKKKMDLIKKAHDAMTGGDEEDEAAEGEGSGGRGGDDSSSMSANVFNYNFVPKVNTTRFTKKNIITKPVTKVTAPKLNRTIKTSKNTTAVKPVTRSPRLLRR